MTDAGAKLPGIYRVGDGARVSQTDAFKEWVPLAHDQLLATARRYNAHVTYKQLAEAVQELSGIRTRQLLTNWIGKLLENVAILAKENGEPPLTSLCIRQDGTIGEGYARAPKSVADSPGADIEQYAAEHRLLCYRKYAIDLPADGGHATLTPQVEARRAAKAARVPPAPVVCPNCWTTLPATGACDVCGYEIA